MDPETYFIMIILPLLMVLTFIALILGFLYIIYGKEKEPEPD
ncbi:MAG: hypothetical protein AOA66_1449 [Candidatus Bathyarchaeota archaeon BA2]|nr:MAG: hypothetical protein AOA66_1449 [Candidatus Bathyarchaeota archaeon BA2]